MGHIVGRAGSGLVVGPGRPSFCGRLSRWANVLFVEKLDENSRLVDRNGALRPLLDERRDAALYGGGGGGQLTSL